MKRWGRLAGRWRWPLAAVAGGLAVFAALRSDPGEAQAASGHVASATAAAPAASAAAAANPAAFGANAQAARAQQLALWQARFGRAEQVYNSYRDATRYPPQSRPLAEHPDQQRPFEPVSEDKALKGADGKPVAGVRLRTTQDRVFMSGAETVRLTVEAVDERGAALPLRVERAAARNLPDSRALVQLAEVPLAFTDDGLGADAAANDGRFSASLTPQAQGFEQHAGTIRILAHVQAGGERGVAHYEVIYEPQVPATWAGGVRDGLERGSLSFFLKAVVNLPGRYVVAGRVLDAQGAPLALVQFNEELPAGPAEIRLQVFGALVHDRRPVFPLRLVDVEGFLLKPDTFPDRAMMARRPGVVHTSRMYSAESFSSAEWTSEERERYLAEYGRDLREAEAALSRLGGR